MTTLRCVTGAGGRARRSPIVEARRGRGPAGPVRRERRDASGRGRRRSGCADRATARSRCRRRGAARRGARPRAAAARRRSGPSTRSTGVTSSSSPSIPNRRRSSCIGTYGRLLMKRRSWGAVQPAGGSGAWPSAPGRGRSRAGRRPGRGRRERDRRPVRGVIRRGARAPSVIGRGRAAATARERAHPARRAAPARRGVDVAGPATGHEGERAGRRRAPGRRARPGRGRSRDRSSGADDRRDGAGSPAMGDGPLGRSIVWSGGGAPLEGRDHRFEPGRRIGWTHRPGMIPRSGRARPDGSGREDGRGPAPAADVSRRRPAARAAGGSA